MFIEDEQPCTSNLQKNQRLAVIVSTILLNNPIASATRVDTDGNHGWQFTFN
jgi:hypothetical protein